MGNGDETVSSTASYDVDDPNGADYCSQTDYHADGTVHVYDAKDGDFSNGYNHTVYSNAMDHFNDDKEWERGMENSSGKSWTDRHAFLAALSELSFVELQQVETLSTNEYVKRSARHFIQISSEIDDVLKKSFSITKN